MNQNFKLKYDQMRDSNPTTHQEPAAENEPNPYDDFYKDESNARNICFVWRDGKRIFMNYSYMVSGEYSPEANTITLSFTTHVFVLKGIHLEGLFYDIMQHLSKQIACVDARYNLIEEGDRFVVNEILMTKSTL